MPTLAEAIRKYKQTSNISLNEIREFVLQIAEDMISNRLLDAEKQLKNQLLAEIQSKIAEIENKPLESVLTRISQLKGERGDSIKGDRGDSPTKEQLEALIKPLIPAPLKGDRGDDYTLTEQDKKQIAKQIEVPVVEKVIEKTEVIKQQPIVKEVAVAETADQIADKLNTLDQKVKQSVIMGLERRFREIIRLVQEKKGGGGGMSNWVTEAPSGSINGVNTSFTITSNVAGGGKAIILLYGGQVQEYTNHFTVSGKTITMLFAPETGTSLFAMYARA